MMKNEYPVDQWWFKYFEDPIKLAFTSELFLRVSDSDYFYLQSRGVINEG